MEPKESLEVFIHNHYKDYCIEGNIKERVDELEEIIRIVWKVATDSALNASRWRKVSEELPEDSMTLKNFTSNAKRTDLVLVRLVDGTIDTDARFVFLALGDNC